ARRPWCSCGHGPCGCGPTDRETSPAHRPWAWPNCCRPESFRLPPSAAASAGRQPPGRSGRSSARRFLAADGGAAKVAGAGEDDVLKLLDGRGGHRRIDPNPILVYLAARGDPERVGPQILVDD